MNIQIGEFIAKPCPANLQRFDLVKIVTKKKKTGEEYQGESEEGYGLQLETVIQKVILSNLFDKKETVQLNEWIAEYKKERDILTKLVNL